MAEVNIEGPPLPELFDAIWKSFEYIDNCEEALADDKIQDKVYFAVKKCEKAIHMVNELSLFSNNETLEEVATAKLKYMLLSALLGWFTSQTTRAERLPLVKKAKLFFIDYIRLCRSYGVTDIELADPDENTDEGQLSVVAGPRGMNLHAMANVRQAKIEQFRQKQDLEKHRKELHELMEKDNVDDEVKREYYTTLLKQWVSRCMEDIESINSEIPILEHMARMKAEQKKHPGHPKSSSPKKDVKPFRPFILTKDMVQKKVFGMGYPAVPTYTIEEFYQQKVEDGTFHVPTSGMGDMSLQDRAANPELAAREQEEYEKGEEQKIEMDDPDELQRKREMDDWKDDHRRGWGNRKNML